MFEQAIDILNQHDHKGVLDFVKACCDFQLAFDHGPVIYNTVKIDRLSGVIWTVSSMGVAALD